MLDAYLEGRIDRLFVVSNKFVNTMTQKPTVEQLIPLVADDDQELKHHWDYLYERRQAPRRAAGALRGIPGTRPWLRTTP